MIGCLEGLQGDREDYSRRWWLVSQSSHNEATRRFNYLRQTTEYRKDKERKGTGTHVVKAVIDKVSDQHLHLGRRFTAMGQILSGHSSISDMLRTTVSQC